MKKKIKSFLHALSNLIYGKHPHNTVFAWNYLFVRKNIAWARKYGKEFKSAIVVDYGCGNLPYYSYFRTHADIYYALDFSFLSKINDKVTYITLNPDGGIPVESIAELEKSELVLSFQVCSELENPERYFSEITKIARRGTKVLITTIFGQTVLGNNDRLRVSPCNMGILLRKLGFKVLVYEPGGFFFTGMAVSFNLLLITKNKYDYNSSGISRSGIRQILFTPAVLIINVLALFFDFLFPLKRSPCQYLIVAEKV
jgi:hypothetical protein